MDSGKDPTMVYALPWGLLFTPLKQCSSRRERAGSGVTLPRFKSSLRHLPVVGFRRAPASVTQFSQL